MKRIFIALSLLCVPLLVFSENKIKMVTYFPVPYVAYSKINASKQLDVGLTSACEMNLGCSESGALGIRPLQATTVNLNRGKLDLNTASAVKSTNVTLGSGSGEANIDFSANLRIGTLNNGYSLEATDMTVDELKLFASHMRTGGEKFPSCAATGASGAPQVSWQKVKLKKAEEVYLVCGTPKQMADCNAASRPSSSQSCNGCGTQTRSVTCDTSTGQWQTGEWSACSGGSPAQTTQQESCSFTAYYYYHSQSDSPSTRLGPATISGTRSRSWNTRTCSWGSWSRCSGGAYVSLGSFTKSNNKSYCQKASSSLCNQGPNTLNGTCNWAQSMGLSGAYCVSPYGSGCYIYQCQTLTE